MIQQVRRRKVRTKGSSSLQLPTDSSRRGTLMIRQIRTATRSSYKLLRSVASPWDGNSRGRAILPHVLRSVWKTSWIATGGIQSP